jgi:FkbH-like protein
MYADERARRHTLGAVGNLDVWLQSLGITVTVEPLTLGNLARATQLLNKTNQMNLTTRRASSQELQLWAARPENSLLTFRVADRFGDSGLTGIVGLTFEGETARVTDFLLSCRVIGRHVEEAMLHAVMTHSRARGASEVVLDFIATARNAPCLEFLRASGLDSTTAHRFTWDASRSYKCPGVITLDDRTRFASSVDR